MEQKIRENPQKSISEQLDALLGLLTPNQIRFVIARQETTTDKEAAESIGVKPDTVRHWKSRGDAPIDDAVQLMAHDGLTVALHIRRRSLGKAMAVKTAGLDSDDERVRQNTATEIIEWEMGKAMQPTKQEMDGELTVRVIYGDGHSDTST